MQSVISPEGELEVICYHGCYVLAHGLLLKVSCKRAGGNYCFLYSGGGRKSTRIKTRWTHARSGAVRATILRDVMRLKERLRKTRQSAERSEPQIFLVSSLHRNEKGSCSCSNYLGHSRNSPSLLYARRPPANQKLESIIGTYPRDSLGYTRRGSKQSFKGGI